jgi:hypothetical protein
MVAGLYIEKIPYSLSGGSSNSRLFWFGIDFWVLIPTFLSHFPPLRNL